ncbi:MAG: hypothetical protein DMG46_22815 [Acidobacteria bacterium]|nr:MAG: hypothetical protein DMG46_22815 [Acidobacteriota bacterium]
MTATDTHRAIDAVWRMESPRLIAGLARMMREKDEAPGCSVSQSRSPSTTPSLRSGFRQNPSFLEGWDSTAVRRFGFSQNVK